MTDGFVLGVDLGTSHTVAMLRRPDGRTRPLLFDGRPLLPSAVYLDPGGRLHVGVDALRLGQADPARLEPHPKRHVDDETVLLGDGAGVPTADLLAALLEAVAREAVATAGFLPPATVTYPASWGAPRRAVLTEALSRAGWPAETALLTEPVAAARYFAEVLRRPLPIGSSLAVFDFGGGTLDVAVVRHDGPGAAFSVTASGGIDDLGGLDLDAALVDHLGKSLAGSEPAAWQALTEPVTLAQWRARRQFWEDVRGAKEMLSRSSFAPVPVPGVEQAIHLTRDELEAASNPLVRRGVAEAGAVIAAAGLKPADLAGLFLVGGSSRVPLVARLLHSELGIAPTVLEQPELPVAEGATLSAARSSNPDATTAASPDLSDAPDHTAAADGPLTATMASTTPTPFPAAPPVPAPVPAPPAAGPPDDRNYAEPVDPWATGEAASIAAGEHAYSGSPSVPGTPSGRGTPTPFGPPSNESWLASNETSPPGGPAAPAAKPRRGRRRWIAVGAAAVVLVLAAGATAAWTLWPRNPSLDYLAQLGEPVDIASAVPMNSGWKDAVVRGNRAYLGNADYETGKAGVVAIDTDATKPAWTNSDAGTAKGWETMIALPVGVALISQDDYQTSTRYLVVLSADKGEKLWDRTLGGDDEVWFTGERAVVDDRANKRLLGLDIATGAEKWSQDDPAGTSAPALASASTPADLSGPAGPTGRPLNPDLDDDPRFVQIGGDRSARVIDGNTGEIKATRPNVAGTNDEIVAHNGRLIVRESEGAHRLVAYGLDKLDGVDIIYTASSSDARLFQLTPCGDDRVCAIEGTGAGDENAQVISVNVTDGKLVWKTAAPDAGVLVPVGEAVIASYSSATRLIDANGKEVWAGTRAAVRLDRTNVLEFSKPLAGYDTEPALAGRHLGDDPAQLGALPDAYTETCSWNTTRLVCATEKDFVIRQFAK
ncbi:Hsp70 family protein [Actinoplanes bogorensis]|uniref:Hsp70 family protein n=1 Tax=Paractinoplanes bogorensis TaxID=1610840 RepID=A0ABS5YIM2_9ACTN|nr:hsp70 family protein [Actinoplanes bogorensis]MBU2663202.1 Hsp70 family protein [Actinoplanes bogorensis]